MEKFNQRTGIINIRFYFCFYRNTVVQLVYIHEWEWNNIGAVVSKQAQCILCVGYKFKSTHLVRLVGGPYKLGGCLCQILTVTCEHSCW